MHAAIVVIAVGKNKNGPAIRLVPESEAERFVLSTIQANKIRELNCCFTDGKFTSMLIGYQEK